MSNKEATAAGVVVIIGLLIAFCIGLLEGARATQKLAIKAGVGHYTVNPTNGITQFEFKTSPK